MYTYLNQVLSLQYLLFNEGVKLLLDWPLSLVKQNLWTETEVETWVILYEPQFEDLYK